jgi:hypothetical protein
MNVGNLMASGPSNPDREKALEFYGTGKCYTQGSAVPQDSPTVALWTQERDNPINQGTGINITTGVELGSNFFIGWTNQLCNQAHILIGQILMRVQIPLR